MLIYQRVNHWIFHDFPIDFFPPNSPIQTFTSFRIIPPSCMRMAVRFSFRSSSGRLSFCRRLWRMMGCNQVPQMTLKWDGQNCLVLYPMKHSISYSILLYIVLYGYIYILYICICIWFQYCDLMTWMIWGPLTSVLWPHSAIQVSHRHQRLQRRWKPEKHKNRNSHQTSF